MISYHFVPISSQKGVSFFETPSIYIIFLLTLYSQKLESVPTQSKCFYLDLYAYEYILMLFENPFSEDEAEHCSKTLNKKMA